MKNLKMEFEICPKCGKFKVPKGHSIDEYGYKIVDFHRSLLFEEKSQATLDGNIKKIQKGRLSFFKRLSIQKGNVASSWEDVLIAVRNDLLEKIEL